MLAWYWVLVAVVITNFLTVCFSDKIDFETFWEEFISIIFYPLIWLGIFPYVFFKGLFCPVSQNRFNEVTATKTDKETIYKLSENIYLWHDKGAKKLQHHWFLIRVEKNRNDF